MAKPKLTLQDFERAAKKLRCSVPAIRAVAHVESLGEGFYADGFPVILFERHKFRSFTQGRYNRSHPHLSGPAGGYGKAGQNQRNKFNEAFALNPTAAMKSCSWGKFQLMGFNHEVCGFDTVDAFVDAMKESEGRQLDAFVNFVIGNNLDSALRAANWAAFAKGYNGAAYKKNKYDTKMASAYARFQKSPLKDSAATAPTAPYAPPVTDKPKIENAPPTGAADQNHTSVEVSGGDVKVETNATNAPLEDVKVKDPARTGFLEKVLGGLGLGGVATVIIGYFQQLSGIELSPGMVELLKTVIPLLIILAFIGFCLWFLVATGKRLIMWLKEVDTKTDPTKANLERVK